MKTSLFTTIIFCMVIFCSTALGIVIYVDDDAPGANNGTSWTNAYTDLQTALAAAVPPDDIRVAQGTYKPTAGTNITVSFQLKNGVGVYGGYGGFAAGNPDDRDVDMYETILSGDIGAINDNSDNSYHVFYHPSGTNLDATAILDGVTITAGNADVHGSTGHSCGGGMYNEGSSSPTINNCTFKTNDSYWGGGGMYNKDNCSPAVTNCTFIDNYAYQWSGGMYNDASSPTVTNCTFTENWSNHGAALNNRYTSNATITNCIFINNVAGSYGGAIDNYKSDPTITDCMFTDNTAEYRGGGMFNWHSFPAITNCTFTGNITESAAGGAGGAMENYDRSGPTIINCTFADNIAEYRGGGIYNNDNSGATVINSILWGNSDLQIDDDDSSLSTVTYSNVQGSFPGTGNINQNPLFAHSASGDYHLKPGSPSIDVGENASVPAGITTDLDGLARIVDGDCDSIATVDMGAYEFDWFYVGDLDGDCDVDLADFAILAASWLQNNPAIDIAPIGNPDGIIDLEDLQAMMANWLAGT